MANSNLASNGHFMPILGLIFLGHGTNRSCEALAEIEEDRVAGRMPDLKLMSKPTVRRREMRSRNVLFSPLGAPRFLTDSPA